MAFVQMRQGLELASAPMAQSLDPGGRKWREGLAVVSARLVVEGRMSEASKILAPLGPHLDPAAVLTAMAEEQLKGGDATVALDAYKAALALCLGCKAEGYWSDSKRAVMECKAWL
ncbi:unnamed protein product [Symbiodinium sp. KB8]|nr:unnamed protein product [Symbiodinium sp. KB8]